MDVNDLFDKAEKLRGLEKLDAAIAVYEQVISLEKESAFLKAESIHMIGVIYLQQKKFDLAEDRLKEAEDMFRLLSDQNLRGAVLRDLAAVAVELNELEKAESLIQQSILAFENTLLVGHLGISHVKLGSIYQKQGKLIEAEKEILKGIELIKQSDERFFESSAYFSLAKLEKELNHLEEARVSANRSLQILEQISEGHEQKKKEIRDFVNLV